ncbi:MAG: glycosyltransferase family 39 protein [Candidatus Methanosuratincola sp.]
MNVLEWKTFFRYTKGALAYSVDQFIKSRSFFVVLIALQLLWLGVIVVTGISRNWTKLLILTIYTLVMGGAVILLPAMVTKRINDFKRWALSKERRLLVVLILVSLVAAGLYAIFQQSWADEDRSFMVARLVSSEGLENAYWESGWLRNKHPPLVPLLYGLTLDIFGVNLFSLRLVSGMFLAATLVLTYLVARELYDRETGYLASIFFLSFPVVVRLGSSAMMDMQLTFFFALAVLLSLHLLKKPTYKRSLFIGLVIGLGMLTKYIMVLVYGVLLSLAVFRPHFRKIKPYLAVAILISIVVFSIWLAYANHLGILSGQIQKISEYTGMIQLIKGIFVAKPAPETGSALTVPEVTLNLANSGIVKLGLESFFTRIPTSLGVYHLPLILLGIIYVLRRRNPSDVFVLLWILVVFVILFLTLPDHRYFLPAFPAIAILIARVINRYPQHKERAPLFSLLFAGGVLYLMVDWVRETYLFFH